jgi:hypothetical protein
MLAFLSWAGSVIRQCDAIRSCHVPAVETYATLQDGFCLFASLGHRTRVTCTFYAGSLKPQYRATIKDITRRMAEGMQKFTEQEVVKTADYDREKNSFPFSTISLLSGPCVFVEPGADYSCSLVLERRHAVALLRPCPVGCDCALKYGTQLFAS